MAKYEKKGNAFIDLETLGKWDDAILLSVGVCILTDEQTKQPGIDYDKLLSQSIEFKLSVADQKALGRKHEQSVMDWWKEQGDSAKKVLIPSSSDLPIAEVFKSIEAFLVGFGMDWKSVRLFDRNGFDIKKLQHLWEESLKLGKDVPWDYQECWEIATILKFLSPEANRYGHVKPWDFKHPSFVYHSAKCDAALDALRFYKLFQG